MLKQSRTVSVPCTAHSTPNAIRQAWLAHTLTHSFLDIGLSAASHPHLGLTNCVRQLAFVRTAS